MSKAAAIRFLRDHVGRVFDTVQVRPGRTPWEPGPRTLATKGAHRFTLGESTVEFTPSHRVSEVTGTSVTVEWTTGTGGDGTELIHTTTYTLAPS